MHAPTEFLSESKNKIMVFFDPTNSHTATHFDDKPELRSLVAQELKKLTLKEPIEAIDVDTQRNIGTTDVVEIDETDEIVYAIRKNRKDQGLVPFTKSRSVQLSTHLAMHLVKIDDRSYDLASAWIGEYESPSFPEMSNATAESIPYWSMHAFVWGTQSIVDDTITTHCSWR